MSASNYDACLSKTLSYEGGYVNHLKDPGGATNYGITIAVARKHWKANATPADMKAMPLSVAKQIYRKEYWDKVGGDALPAGPDLCVFDFGVNSGVSRANKYHAAMPKALNPMTYVKEFCKRRLSFLRGLGTWATFGKGWARRVADVEATGVKMALQATGLPKHQVNSVLEAEAKASATKAKGQGAASATTAAGSGSQVPALPDVSQVDASTTAGLIFIGLVVLGVAGFFAYRAYVNHQRAKAYAGAAKED